MKAASHSALIEPIEIFLFRATQGGLALTCKEHKLSFLSVNGALYTTSHLERPQMLARDT